MSSVYWRIWDDEGDFSISCLQDFDEFNNKPGDFVTGHVMPDICEVDRLGLKFFNEEDAKIYVEELDKIVYRNKDKIREKIRTSLNGQE